MPLTDRFTYNISHSFTAARYGVQSPQFNEQGIGYAFNILVGGLSSNLNLLEHFDPNRIADPFRWVPQGLYYDMIDERNETRITGGVVDDLVNGNTNLQFFNALDTDINTLQLFRQRLLTENGNNQNIPVTNLFFQYGY